MKKKQLHMHDTHLLSSALYIYLKASISLNETSLIKQSTFLKTRKQNIPYRFYLFVVIELEVLHVGKNCPSCNSHREYEALPFQHCLTILFKLNGFIWNRPSGISQFRNYIDLSKYIVQMKWAINTDYNYESSKFEEFMKVRTFF